MTGNIALDVVIGLVFIYALYSLFVTTFVELVSTAFSFRSRNLAAAIRRMLDDDSGKGFFHDFYTQPLIKYLSEKDIFVNRLLKMHNKPSYLKARNFSMAVIQLLQRDSWTGEFSFGSLRNELENGRYKDTQTAKYLLSLLNNSEGRIEKFREHLERWFDDTMERATGWFKRKIMLVTLLTGVAIAWMFNVDTIQIVKKLSKDPKAREQYVMLASRMVNDSTLMHDATRNALYARMDSLLVLSNKSTEILSFSRDGTKGLLSVFKEMRWWFDDWNNLWGCLITALAMSLGAPFWFDLLSKLVQIKSSLYSKKTEKEQESKKMEG